MTDDQRAEYLDLKYRHLAEQEARAAQPQPDLLAEELARPAETRNARHIRELAERDAQWAQARADRARAERERAEEQQAAAVDWGPYIGKAIQDAILAERDHLYDVLAELIAEGRKEFRQALAAERKDAKNELSDEVRSLNIELAELQTTMCEFRQATAERRGDGIDIPNPLSRGRAN